MIEAQPGRTSPLGGLSRASTALAFSYPDHPALSGARVRPSGPKTTRDRMRASRSRMALRGASRRRGTRLWSGAGTHPLSPNAGVPREVTLPGAWCGHTRLEIRNTSRRRCLHPPAQWGLGQKAGCGSPGSSDVPPVTRRRFRLAGRCDAPSGAPPPRHASSDIARPVSRRVGAGARHFVGVKSERAPGLLGDLRAPGDPKNKVLQGLQAGSRSQGKRLAPVRDLGAIETGIETSAAGAGQLSPHRSREIL